MAFNEIPKIQWRYTQLSGLTTLGSDIISLISSTADLRVGMIVETPDFPAGTKIIDIPSANTVQVSNLATAATSSLRTYFFEFAFRYPAETDDGESHKVKERKSVSIAGDIQRSIDHVEFKRTLEFNFLTKDEIEDLRAFWNDWAYLGNAFRYFEDKNSVSFIEYEPDDLDFDPKKFSATLWKWTLKVRRVQ